MSFDKENFKNDFLIFKLFSSEKLDTSWVHAGSNI